MRACVRACVVPTREFKAGFRVETGVVLGASSCQVPRTQQAGRGARPPWQGLARRGAGALRTPAAKLGRRGVT